MYKMKKSTLKLISTILAVSIAIPGLATPKTALAAAPTAVPSQITMAIGGGATDGKTAIGFNWLTDTNVSASEIVYGTSADLAGGTTKSATLSVPVPGGSVPDNKLINYKELHMYKVTIQDLVPETKYYYKVGNASNGYSAIASFIAPMDPTSNKPFSFVVSPDTQGVDAATYKNTADLYTYILENESDAAFLIHNGDVVEDASMSDHWQYFFDAAQNLTSTLPIMATPGNHDSTIYDKDAVQYTSRFNYTSLRKPSGLSERAEGTVYSFEYGDALFISLNSFPSSADDVVQWRFLAEEAAATTKKWKIVNLHASPYDPGSSHYQVDNVTGKKFTDAGIDLVLAGHEHAYARTTLKTISSEKGTDSIRKAKFGEAPTYVIGGTVYNYAYGINTAQDTSWNDFFYDLRINKTSSSGGAVYSPGVYSKAEVTSNSIIYKTYYKATGSDNPFRVIDEFTIMKSGDSVTQPTGGGKAPTSVTFMFDSFNQELRKPEADKYIARFNWVTPVTTKITHLFYAKKSDFDSNGGKFTNFVVGTNSDVDLSSNIANANYNSAGKDYSIAPIQSHKAETAVLDPGTEYVYSVGDGGKNMTSVTSPASFKTPTSNLDTFNFNWISDAQMNSPAGYESTLNMYTQYAQKALRQAFAEFPDASFLLSSGDQVNFGFDTWEWDAFFEANEDLFARVPLYMATGNHEYDGAGNDWAPNRSWDSIDPTLQNLLGRHNPPKNGASYYGGGDGTERMVSGIYQLQFESSNYYYVYGDTLFLIMDYQDQSTAAQIKAQEDWMRSVVKQNPTKWRVAVFHKSLFGYRMATPVSSWTDAFDDAGIDMVLMGHDHVYVRTKLFANGANIEPQTYGNGTTYITNYSANNDRRGPLFVDNNRDASKMAYVDVRPIGPGFVNVSITPSEIRVTSKGYDPAGTLQTGENNVLITNKPRTPNLSAWSYPAVPQESNEFTVKNATITGIAKEGQSLNASITPSSAAASFKWERSTNSTTWAAISGATGRSYTIKAEDVGSYLRVVATGTGFYNGVATSSASAKVTPLAGSGSQSIKIGTANELIAFSDGFGTAAYPIDGKYELSADIDMNLADKEFAAIGGGATQTPFIGTFNGKSYTIDNLKITSSNNGIGFFAYIGDGGKVVNLKLSNVDITGNNNTGAIAGISTGTIENSYVDGKVTGNTYVGGIVGLLHAGTLQNNFISAQVSGVNVGGLIGGTAFDNSGSPLAEASKTASVIRNNFVTGTVTVLRSGQYFGAMLSDMAGSKGNPLQTLNGNILANTVTAVNPNGPIAGYWSSSITIKELNQVNFYDIEKLGLKVSYASGNLPSGVSPAFTGKATADFAMQATFEALGWDFTSVWNWDSTNNVPVPRTLSTGDEGDSLVTIIASAGNGGTISPSGYVLVERGQSQKFTFTPKTYFAIDTVTIDGVVNEAAAAAGEYTFDNVTSVHLIEVTFKLSGEISGVAPSVISTSAYYNRAVEAHIHVELDFGSGALGIAKANWGSAVKSVTFKTKDGALVLDATAGSWFPGPSYGQFETTFEICYDDFRDFDGYDNLVAGEYVLEIIFDDLNSTVATIPLFVADGTNGGGEDPDPEKSSDASLSALTVGGVSVVGFKADTLDYTLSVPNSTTKVSIAAIAADSNATVTGTGDSTLKVGDNIVTVTVTAEDGTTNNVYTITINRAEASNPDPEKSSDASLSDLNVDGIALAGFKADTLHYTLNVPNSTTKVSIAATAADSKATITGTGDNTLKVGANIVTVTVTAEDGTTNNVYTITINRAEASNPDPEKSSDASLSALTLGGVSVVGFKADTLDYTLSVPNSTTKVSIAATAADSKATITGTGDNTLKVGANIVTVTVTAEDGTTKNVYTITINRAEASKDNSGTDNGGNIPPVFEEEKSFAAGQGGTVKFANNAITITLPAGATEKELTVTVKKVVNTSQLVTDKEVLLSSVFEILKNFSENFSKPITLTFSFDSKVLGANQTASIFYYDEVKKEWVEIGGTVNGDQISAKVDHFTKFAVFVVDKKVEDDPEVLFSDIEGHWAEAIIKLAGAKGIVSGYADGTFKPKGDVTRAEFTVMLARALNLQGSGAVLEFTDKASIDAWAKQGIAQAVQAGIVKGYGDGSFKPNAKISRAEMVTMLANALGFANNSKAKTTFADDANIPAWAREAVAAAVESGIVQGVGGNRFAPNQTATRAEAAVVLLKALEFAGK